MIQSYRDDPDLQNMIDWIQRHWLHCCGVNNYRNWESNIYFNCSSKIVGSIEACGVPASCCRAEYFHVRKYFCLLRKKKILFLNFRIINNVDMEH
jgi:tetraspanin-5